MSNTRVTIDKIGLCFQPEDGYVFTDKEEAINELGVLLDIDDSDKCDGREYFGVTFWVEEEDIGYVIDTASETIERFLVEEV